MLTRLGYGTKFSKQLSFYKQNMHTMYIVDHCTRSIQTKSTRSMKGKVYSDNCNMTQWKLWHLSKDSKAWGFI